MPKEASIFCFDTAGDFAAARGEADQHGALQVERFNEFREAVGIGVHFVTAPGMGTSRQRRFQQPLVSFYSILLRLFLSGTSAGSNR